MAMQETTLTRRVARSAKDLTLATVSGAGAASGLKDPRDGKQSGSSTQVTQNRTGQQSGLHSRLGTWLGSPESSFRSQASASASRAAEEDFDLFQAHEDFSDAWQMKDLVAELTGSSFEESSSEYLHDYPDISSTTHHHGSEIFSEGIADFENREQSSEFKTDLSARTTEHESNADLARASAFRRLNQIGAHLQRNVALQKLQQDVHVPSYDLHGMMRRTHSEHYQPHAAHDQESAHDDQSHLAKDFTQPNMAQRHYYPLPASNEREEKKEAPYSFNCPYYECHRILDRLDPSSLRSDSKPCVHDGCWFHAEGMEAWLEHIQLPHHDLQGTEQ